MHAPLPRRCLRTTGPTGATLRAIGFQKNVFNSDDRFAPQQNISCKTNIMTKFFGLGASKAGFHHESQDVDVYLR